MTPQQKLAAFIRDTGVEDLAEEIGIELPSKTDEWLNKFITCNSKLLEIKDRVRKLSKTDFDNINVLITGETGTGKELIARALHGERQGEFVAVNCAGIPESLLEAEFFGCVKGAYTGSHQDRLGYLEEAAKGTLFLDEIGDMPPLLQAKLLRVLQERKARRIGSVKEYNINCRIVSATNKTVDELKSGCYNFRLDLYYRLAGSIVKLLPLRERPEDVKLLLAHFGAADLTVFQSGLDSFKGNVRELINMVDEFKLFGKLEN